MSTEPASPETEADPALARAARRSAMLETLSEIGMAFAHALREQLAEAQAGGEADEAVVGSLALSFARVARAVRQTVGLAERLEDGLAARQAEAKARRTAEALRRHRLAPEVAARKAEVEDAIARQLEIEVREKSRSAQDAEAKLDGLYERLEDLDADILDVNVSVVVERICRALGVTPDWSLWQTDSWAMDEAEWGGPTSPYAETTPRRRIAPDPDRAPVQARALPP
jgi:hypothetical protein